MAKGSHVPSFKLTIHGKEAEQYVLRVLSGSCEPVVSVELGPKLSLVGSLHKTLRELTTETQKLPDFFIIHDAAKPMVSQRTLDELKSLLNNGRPFVSGAVRLEGLVLSRSGVIEGPKYEVSPPEGISSGLLADALRWGHKSGIVVNSISSLLWRWQKIKPTLIELPMANPRLENVDTIASAEGRLKFGQPYLPGDLPDLRGIRVLLLGGSGGIGRACIDLFSELGADVDAPNRTQLDLSHDVPFHTIEGYHAVVHAAAEYQGSPAKTFKVNYFSCVELLELAEQTSWQGRIVFLSSSSSTWGRQGIVHYSASKSALNALVEAEGPRLATKGILVNAVAPGKVRTRLQEIINPHLDPTPFLSPRIVARVVARYIQTSQAGSVAYIRQDFDHD